MAKSNPVTELVALAQLDLNSYTEVAHANKEAFHRRGKAVAKLIAERLGLAPGTYDVRSNKGGMAGSGEITLHTETLYVQFSGFGFNGSFMYRSCKGRKDYTGGMNLWMKWSELADFDRACETFRATARLVQPDFTELKLAA